MLHFAITDQGHWIHSLQDLLHMCAAVYDRDFDAVYLTLTVLVTTIDAQWEGMVDVGSARYEPALLPLYPTIRVLSNSN